eukprot:13155364-Alexandrium_andersonii.AAC.1
MLDVLDHDDVLIHDPPLHAPHELRAARRPEVAANTPLAPGVVLARHASHVEPKRSLMGVRCCGRQ